MKRVLTCAVLFATVFAVASVRNFAQSPATANPGEILPGGFSVVVRDAEKSGQAWADVLGIPAPVPFVPQQPLWPPQFWGDRSEVGPKISLFRLANTGLTLHEPPPGRNYWRALLDKHGETLYRFLLTTNDLVATTSYFQQKGATLELGDPANSPYVNISLWPKYGFAWEIVVSKPTPEQLKHPVVLKPAPSMGNAPPPTAFASNPVASIGFVVPNLDRAIQEYTDLFRLPASAVTRVTRPSGFPAKTATLNFSNGTVLELNEPQGQGIFQTRLQKHGTSMFTANFTVKNVQEQITYLKGKGGTLVLGGGANDKYAYLDFTPRLGAIIAIHE